MDPGAPVRVVATKWGGRPHWEFDAVWLGVDEHGSWVGVPVGTVIARPGATVVTRQLQVVLFPSRSGFVATFYDDANDPPCRVYVDIATVPVVEAGRISSVDLDLDVIVGAHGRMWVDDEDEFADHRVRWGYPDDVVADALSSCDAVQLVVAERRPPFDVETSGGWLRVLERHTLDT